MNKPTFSIVIPVFNNLELFRRALESVLQQQGVAFEIIVTDDSTTAAIADYVNGLAVSVLPADIHLRYCHHQSDSGAISNWNNGLQMATGQYIILMHHDEAMSGTDYLQRIESHFNGGADIVVSNIEVIVDGHQKKSHFTTPLKRFALCHPSLQGQTIVLWLTVGHHVQACYYTMQVIQPFLCLCVISAASN